MTVYPETTLFHGHIKCRGCIREVEDLKLSSEEKYEHPDVQNILQKWIPKDAPLQRSRPLFDIRQGNWTGLSPQMKSLEIGKTIGFCYGEITNCSPSGAEVSDLFPLSIKDKVTPKELFMGLVQGLMKSSSLSVLFRGSVFKTHKVLEFVTGSCRLSISRLVEEAPMLNLIRGSPLYLELVSDNHKVPSSYPVSLSELGTLLNHYLRKLVDPSAKAVGLMKDQEFRRDEPTWIFADLSGAALSGPYLLGEKAIRILRRTPWSKRHLEIIKGIKELLSLYRDSSSDFSEISVIPVKSAISTGCQLREGAKDLPKVTQTSLEDRVGHWGKLVDLEILSLRCPVLLGDGCREEVERVVPRYDSPVIRMVRHYECPTGAPLKLWAILSGLSIRYNNFLACGDGSGGMTNLLLAQNKDSRGIFNSLLEITDLELGGSKPEPPSGISVEDDCHESCVNLKTCWQEPSDLRHKKTWRCFSQTLEMYRLTIDLIVLDMQHQEGSGDSEIIGNLEWFLKNDRVSGMVTCVFKTFLSVIEEDSFCLRWFTRFFNKVFVVQTEASGFKTSGLHRGH